MLAPWKKSYGKPRQHIKKQRHHFANKGLYSPGVMYGCESWTIKKAECWRTDAFELWCWTKTLESPLDSKEIKPVSPKENQPWMLIGRTDAKAKTPNSLATWCKEPTHWKRPWCWARLKAKGEGASRGWDDQIASPTQWTWIWASSGRVKDREAWHSAVHGVANSQTWLTDWITTTCYMAFSKRKYLCKTVP